MKRRFFVLITLVLLASFVLAACGGGAEEPTAAPTTAPEPTTAPAEAPTAAPAEQPTAAPADTGGEMTSVGASAEGAASAGLTCLADAYNGQMQGTVVSMSGPFTDEDTVKFENSIKAFEDATGIDIQYEGSKEFEASIGVRFDAGDPPDVVDFPQPGLMATFARQGKVIPVTDMVPESWLSQNYLQSWRDMATVDGTEYGVWQRFNGKSLVWYPKAAFEAAGYEVPTTWEELQALEDQIVSDGDTPWCIGIESGAATGWPATDWTEEFMLRTTSLENYDAWVAGELPFSSPEVKNAIETFANIWNDSDMVYGGTPAIVTTFFGDAPTPMFEDPPGCWLHKQGNFITSFFPPDAVYGEDYGVFYLPGVDPQYGKPFLVAGDVMAATEDRPEVCAVMQYFSTGEGIRGWLAAGGALGMQNDVQLDWYGSPLEADIAGLVKDATSVRFDGSDLMPGAVGSGSF
ncbi:MAG: ABC transporter substrate-binding protein [Caldilineales bacterium]